MKNQIKNIYRFSMLILLLGVAGMTKMYAYDFSAVCETGQTLYYSITDAENHYVKLVCPGSYPEPWPSRYPEPTGTIILPNDVTYNGVIYSVKEICDHTFYGCSGLTGSLIIPNSVISIGGYAFSGCSGLTGSLIIPNSVISIGGYAFSGCSGLTGSLIIPNSVISIGNGAFQNCTGFNGTLTLGNSLETIGRCAFTAYNSPYSSSPVGLNFTGDLFIPNSVTSIGEWAFGKCSCFTGSLTIGSSVTSIGEKAFSDCSGFTEVIYNATNCADVMVYHASPFIGCGGILTIGGNVERIPNNMFRGTAFTGGLIIPNSVTSIGNSAFSGCSGFTGSLTIPNSVTSIGNSAFSGCSGFTGSLTIPNSVTTIGNNAFANCSGVMESLTIGNSVTMIGDHAFYGCSGLTSIAVFAETPPTLQSGSFDVPITIPVHVPCNCAEAYQGASGWSNFTNIIEVCSVSIAASASPAVGGSVVGGGTFDFGATCTVTAIPNQGYHFWYWTENGHIVSNQSNYTFSAVSDIDLVAVFSTIDPSDAISFVDSNVKALCIANWDVNGDGELSYTEAGMVTTLSDVFREDTVITSFNELQYFTGLNSINTSAFYGCSGLATVEIPNSVTSIIDSAFYGCSGLTELTIGESIITIGDYAFWNCPALATVHFNATNCVSMQTQMGDGYSYVYYNSVFSGSGNDGVTPIVTLTIGENVTRIPDYAFYGSIGLTGDLTIPNSVTSIGYGAFGCCSGFESIVVESGNTSYDSRENCNALINTNTNELMLGCRNTIIPNSVNSIGFAAFAYCTGLTSLELPNSVMEIGDDAFGHCSGLTGNLTIPNSVTTIGGFAFDDCSSLTSLTIGNSVTAIGYYAFYNCSGLTDSLIIPNSVTSIGYRAFSGCSGLTSLTIPNSVTTIGSEAFNDCSFNELNVNMTTIPDNFVNHIGGSYSGSLTIGSSVISIGNDAFAGCSFDELNIDMINIPNRFVNNVGGNYLGSLTIGNSVILIGSYAFFGCSGLTSLTIGNSVTSIGIYAFYNCSGLTEIWSKNPSVPFLGSVNVFEGVDKTIPVHVPCSSMNDYRLSYYWRLFNNYYENPNVLIVSSNDEILGWASVTKYGDCDDNESIVQALPYIGSFVNWTTPDGTVVSTDATYTLALTEDFVLVANFEPVANAYAFVGGSTTNHWNDPDNWIPNELPTETSSVGILADAELNVDVNVASVSIFDNNSVTINPDVTLTVTETLSTPTITSIVVEEGGQLVHANDGALATVKRSITPYSDGERDGWHLIASPSLDNVDVSEIENLMANEYDLYYYDEPTHYWMNQKYADNDFTVLENGKGYLYGNNCYTFSFEAQVGNGTSTIDYFPFYTYYDNSITESLFLAEELENAGVTIDPMTSLSWYATNQTGYLQSNISIWMANVSENALTTTSHNTNGMTLVYTGAMTPEIGWNEFVFNEGCFAWDGVSNILICVQRNNGVWNSKIQWQSHNCGFVGMAYAYRDHSGSNPNSYDMENETYTMNTSTSRANTIFKKLGYDDNSITISFIGELENGASMVDIPLSYTEAAGSLKGFNLVGNPFAHNVTSYAATNVAEGCFRMNEAKDNLIVSEVSETLPLKPAEGFFVKATAEGASITFNAPRSRGETARKGFINLELSKDGKLIDRLIVKKDGKPLEKLSLNEARTKLFAQGEHQELAIVSCEGNEQAVCFKAERNGTYTLNAKMDGLDLNYLHLIDNMTGNDINLLSTPSYTFEAKTSDYASRFRLVFSAIGNTDDEDKPFAFISNDDIIVTGDYANSTLQIVDMLGHVVVSTDAAHNVSTNGITSGVYVLRLINGDDVKTQKIVVR